MNERTNERTNKRKNESNCGKNNLIVDLLKVIPSTGKE